MNQMRALAAAASLVLLLAGSAAAQEPGGHHQHHAPAPPATSGSEQVPGMKIPDVQLLDQEGRPVHFYRDLVQGRVVAVNFIFTSCTTICPPMAATFGKLRSLLGPRAGRDVHLVSVSVDPVVDSPARMKAWSQKFGPGPGWTLVTGEKAEVERLLKAFGVFAPDVNDHTPLVLVGNDARGEWTRTYGLAAPAKLMQVIDQVAAAKGNRKGGQR